LDKGYEVHGIRRRTSLFNTDRIDHIYTDPLIDGTRLFLHYGDLTDSSSLTRVIQSVRPDEIYNLAAQSHVAVSFEEPEYTADSDAVGTLRLLEAIRILGLEKDTRFYQASTSELYGDVAEVPQNEQTPFRPRSPYAVAKLYSYWITVNYREAYGIYACNGILFNHESPRRGENFVTRKITRAFAAMVLNEQECLYLGNMDSGRDWGHARDYVEMQWLMLQQDEPKDYVISTGEQHSVREFVEQVAARYGLIMQWSGTGVEETGKAVDWQLPEEGKWWGDRANPESLVGRQIVAIDPKYFRPSDVVTLLGNSQLARDELGWSPRTSFPELVDEMTKSDLSLLSGP